MRPIARLLACALLSGGLAAPVGAQSAALEARLRAALPADVADRVIARMADARQAGLPDEVLAAHALQGVSRGAPPDRIDEVVSDEADRLQAAHDALAGGRGHAPTAEEAEAGAETLRRGVSGDALSALAAAAPSGRSLAVPLYAVSALVDRGLPADGALAAVRDRLLARAGDVELVRLADTLGRDDGQAHRPDNTGLGIAAAHRAAGGPPAGVPANAGSRGRVRGSRPIGRP